ncbi:putative kunitz/Bovine pancreatic trypsin inhibitor domain protein [Trichinella spiralis]|uniref:putative kunitz/Bovine pancreatic trypsin inhibitor domain protein n=1 Tax=Trichinella spiralis TaxID=6334 RepID=UPI0001EFD740|nr:putative kunitz/Bovine pancreatic trypsin inhibitor domain protein [Trichinella spiralis]
MRSKHISNGRSEVPTKYVHVLQQEQVIMQKLRLVSQNAIVGVPCNENIDCQTTDGGTYCDTTKRCACLPSFVNINGFCYKKINPGQSGCTYEEQCNSVWPGAYCSSDSICKCPDGQPPQRTRDGTVCTFPGSCPTNGIYSKLKGVDGYETPCSDGSDDYCPPTYDCLCNPPSLSSGSACTRTLACIMPRDEGVFTGITVDRWYYNSMTSSCDLFSYRGGGGNANNFETKSQCESYCKTGCPRGQPLYSPGNIADRVPKDSRVTCSVSRTCAHDSNFYCHANQAVAFICSQEGGLPTGSTTYVIPPTSFDPGLAGAGVTPKQRYYYDSDKRQCLPFTYNGQAGNFNNFDSESECKQFCSKTICPAGEPLRDNGNSLITCGVGGSGICPVRYECTNDGYCCPSREFVCNQEQAVGACANYAEQVVNAFSTLDVKEISTTSIHMNSVYHIAASQQVRNFNGILMDNKSALSPNVHKGLLLWKVLVHMQSAEAVLILTPARQTIFVTMMVGGLDAVRQGRKHAALIRLTLELFALALQFHVGIIIQEVKNVKRFGIMAVTETPTILPPELIAKITVMLEAVRKEANLSKNLEQVNLGYVMVILSAAQLGTLALEHQSNRLVCVTITVVLLEASSIKKLQTMKVYFVVLLATICSLGRDPGAHCDCPAGQIALRDVDSETLTICSMGMNTCPSGYSCVQSKLLGRSICCGSSAPSGVCPSGQIHCPQGGDPYMEPFLNTPRQCTPGISNTCPANYVCQSTLFNVGGLQSATGFCCGTPTLNPCPTGKQPYRYEGAPVVCTQGSVTAGCPPGYSCDLHAETNSFYCCAFGGAQPVPPLPGEGCPSGYITIQPHRYCSPTVPGSCPSNAVCSYHRNLNRYMCCMLSGMAPCMQRSFTLNMLSYQYSLHVDPTPELVQNPCTAPRQPYMNPVTYKPQVCLLGGTTTGCPAGYSCEYNKMLRNYYCCSKIRSICKPGYVPYIDAATRQPLICPLNVPGFRCPEGYQCTYSDVNHQYYCCRRAGVVRPNGGQESQVVGSACQTNDDCRPSPGENALCHDGLCACSASEMNLNGLCVTDKCPSPYQHVNGECVPVLSS